MRPAISAAPLVLAALQSLVPVAAPTLVAGTALAPAVARAEKADSEKPIAWSAARLTGRRQEGGQDVVEVDGKVVVTQGTRTIQADKAIIRQNSDGSMSATATGNPVSFREKRDGSDQYVEAFAQRAEYDGAKKVLELFDRALLRRDKDEVRAGYIWFNTETEAYRAEGQKDAKSDSTDSRVRGVIQPKPRDTKGEATPLVPATKPRS